MKIETVVIHTQIIVNINTKSERTFNISRAIDVEELNSMVFKEFVLLQMNIIHDNFLRVMAQDGYEF